MRCALGVSSASRLSERSSVVLPQPDGPISASTSPWRTGSVTSLTAGFVAVGDRQVLGAHPLGGRLGCAGVGAGGARWPAGGRGRAVSVCRAAWRPTVGLARRPRSAGSAAGRSASAMRLSFRVAIRSTAKLRRITISSSTKAAAYAFSGALPSPAGELL